MGEELDFLFVVRLGILIWCWVSARSQCLVRFLSLCWITGSHTIHLPIEGLLPPTGTEPTPLKDCYPPTGTEPTPVFWKHLKCLYVKTQKLVILIKTRTFRDMSSKINCCYFFPRMGFRSSHFFLEYYSD